ncbi:MAG: ParB/RepB/Spo0J family partition protein [Aristaeellaceae bacterium]
MEKNVGQVRQIAMGRIRVAERIRKENGSLDELAQDIQKHGLLNPITVMEQADGGYVLIAGLRRMKAMEQLNAVEIRATVMSPMEADEMLMLEIAENEQRKEFTVSEKLAFAEKLRAVEKEKAHIRMSVHARDGHGDGQGVGNCPSPESQGKVREIVAKKVGFSSDRQMRRAQEVAEKRPDLMDRVDKGEQTISGAYRDMQQAEKPKVDDSHSCNAPLSSFIEEEPVDIPDYEVYKPAQQEAPGNVRTVKGADHEHLLENPIYRRLYESYNEAVQQINLVRGDMRTRCEGYERRIRAYRENIQTLQREVERLKEVLHAGA